MSLRPRLAGDGVVRLPMTVGQVAPSAYYPEGGVTGRIGEVEYDPFERLPEGLLLCESFARTSFDAPARAAAWYERHGAVDISGFFGTFRLSPGGGPDAFQDEIREIGWQQETVRWHLESLVRLSDHLPGRGLTPSEHPVGWNTDWSRPVLSFGEDLVRPVPGGVPLFIPGRVQRSPEPTGAIPEATSIEQFASWWRTTRNAYEALVVMDPPVVTAGNARAWDTESRDDALDPPREARILLEGLGDGWWSLARLQVRLLLPSIERAGEPRIELSWDGDEDDQTKLGPLSVREVRRWTSVLSPIHLQLFEALRRVTEGNRGAGRCRECGHPFLILDARRSSFCTDRERLRWAQRDHRQRAAERAVELDIDR